MYLVHFVLCQSEELLYSPPKSPLFEIAYRVFPRGRESKASSVLACPGLVQVGYEGDEVQQLIWPRGAYGEGQDVSTVAHLFS